MATMLTETPEGYRISLVVGRGKRRRIPRSPVVVPYGDPEWLKEALMDQVYAARVEVGMEKGVRRPVV